MGAYKDAIEMGVDALEVDLHMSKDGVAVLSHVGSNPEWAEHSSKLNAQRSFNIGPYPQALFWKGR